MHCFVANASFYGKFLMHNIFTMCKSSLQVYLMFLYWKFGMIKTRNYIWKTKFFVEFFSTIRLWWNMWGSYKLYHDFLTWNDAGCQSPTNEPGSNIWHVEISNELVLFQNTKFIKARMRKERIKTSQKE